MMKKKIVFYLVLFIPKFAYAYQFKQAKFKNFNVVFPQQIEEDIPKFLTQLDKIYDLTFFSLGEQLENIKIFLGNSSEVNAFAIVPNRASYVNYDFLCSTYLSTLVHEMRHIAQYSSFFRPLKSPLKCLFIIDLDKSWLMEGDAVITETILTSDGRGRDPYFLLYEKTKILNNDENINYASFYYNNWYSS